MFNSTVRSIEVIIYQENCSSIDKILDVIKTKDNIRDYAVVLHDKDKEGEKDKKHHYHVELWFYQPQVVDALIKWFTKFKVKVSNLDKIQSRKSVLAYLTHSNEPQKHQYDITEVKHSKGIEEELNISTSQAKRTQLVRNYCDAVAMGNMSPRALYASLNGIELRDNAKLIQGSIDARLIKAQAKGDRDMKVVYITGKSGTGKSTLARYLALGLSKEPPYISSSSNDPLQDYLLEDVIILDDLRGDAFKFADLLKLTDNYVASSIKCRFKNKSIGAKYLFITSTRKPEELYAKDTFSKDDNLDQFLRRIQCVYELDANGDIHQSKYILNSKTHHLEKITEWNAKGNMSTVFAQMDIVQQASTLLDKMNDLLGGKLNAKKVGTK